MKEKQILKNVCAEEKDKINKKKSENSTNQRSFQ